MIIKQAQAQLERYQKTHAQKTPSKNTKSSNAIMPSNPSGWNLSDFQAGHLPDRRQQGHFTDSADAAAESAKQEGYQNGYDTGHNEGYATGFEQGLAQANDSVLALQQQLEQCLHANQQAIEQLSRHLAPLAVAIAEKLIKTQVLCDETIVQHMAYNSAAALAKDNPRLIIQAHPLDVDDVERYMAEKPLKALHAVQCAIEANPSVSRGSCRIQTDGGLVDMSFDTQLLMLRRLLGIGEEG